ncbi:helix-turn-helix domain-containing protein [Cumulibacter manganitolerans]|uniref:helix-turn-helix domain-containing protein n=1 Tax=Cumulibacter manganitolerans TaxID=1884992 RepID=UPI0018864D98|nr:GAF domain-containing protein [Cumulibacter manganitolerans]
MRLLDLLDEERVIDPDELSALIGAEDLDEATCQQITDRIQRVQAHLSRAGRRRDEVAALFASSRELAEQREFDTLLRRLVQRARDLVGADLAWLSELDVPRGELVVQAAVGSVSAELERLRITFGQSMAWHVASHKQLHYSARYHDDPRFRHNLNADSVLVAEGAVSVLAVPLVAGDEVIGTLCVATRTETRFHPEQIALLTAFADHGAVILQGARLLAQAQTSAEEAGEARRRLAALVERMEQAHNDHVELTECVLRGQSVAQVAAVLATSMRREVFILDTDGQPLVDSPAHFPVEGCWRHPEVVAAIATSRSTGRYVPTSAPGVAGVVAVLAGDTHLGSLVVTRTAELLDPVQLKTIEDAARIMALLRLKQDAQADAEERVRGDLLHDLVEPGSRGTEEVRIRARARGLNLDELTRLFIVSAGSDRAEVLRTLRTMPARPSLVAEHAGVVLVVFAESARTDGKHLHRWVRARLRLPVLVVEAPHASSCDEVAARYREARRCLDMLPALGIHDAAVATAAYRPYLRLFEPNADDIDEFIRTLIGPLLDRDEDRGTELLQTVSTFAECNASTSRTARALHLHSNTILQRISRVDELLGPAWREPDDFFRIQVAIRLHRLRGRASPNPDPAG